MKIAFVMPTPFDLGGEQRVTSIISNILEKQGNEVTIICINKNAKEDRSLYNLNSNIKILYVDEKSKKEKYISFFYKLLAQVNKRTILLKNNTVLLEKMYRNRDINTLKYLSKTINENNYDVVIGVGGKYSLLLTFLKNDTSAKIVGWQHSSYDAYFNTKKRYHWHEYNIFKKRLQMLDKYIVLTQIDKEKIDNNFNIESLVINNPKSFISNQVTNLSTKIFYLLEDLCM